MLDFFVEYLLASVGSLTQKPTMKMLREKVRNMLNDRAAKNISKERASGILEKLSETDLLKDDLLHEKKENEKKQRESFRELNEAD